MMMTLTSSSAAPSIKEIDALLSGATPHFSMQLKARLWAMISELPPQDSVRQYGELQMTMLDRLAAGTTRGEPGPGTVSAEAEGWEMVPSHPHGS